MAQSDVIRGGRQNRDRMVLEAALTVISERGYPAASIQQVADKVGVLKGSLYHYFTSKEDLLFRIIEDSWNEYYNIIEQSKALGLSPLGELSEYLRRSCIWYLQNVEQTNIWFTDARHLTGERLEQVQDHSRKFQKYIHGLIVAAQKDGSISTQIDARLLGRYVVGALQSVRTWSARSSRSFTIEQMADSFVDMTCHLLGASPRKD